MIGNRIGRRAGGSWMRFWATQSDVLFFGLVSEISGGQMPNKVTGATDYLTVTGAAGSYTFECPNTAPYIAADTDYIWFEVDETLRTTTESELVSYDFTRSIIKYEDVSDYSIEAIMILSSDVDTNKMRDDFHLSIWWSDVLSLHGSVKGNRGIGQAKYAFTFITTWDTEKAGSATKTIVVPTTGAGYDCYIDWGDGGAEEHQVGTPGNITHVYATTGIKTVKIRGLFSRIYFNNSGDKLKLLTIAQWSNIVWSSMKLAFAGCANLTGTYVDYPNTTVVTSMEGMFSGCSKFNSNVSNFNTVAVTNMSSMFYNCLLFNHDVSGFDVHLVTSMLGMLHFNNAFSTVNYDLLLNINTGWPSQAVQNNVELWSGDTTVYTQDLVDSGTTDGTTANKLVDSTQNFVITVTIGDVVRNITDGTYAIVTAIDDDATLSLSVDIMITGKNYAIQHSDAAKGRAKLVLTNSWTIRDGGPA